jgi:hypothetical protein
LRCVEIKRIIKSRDFEFLKGTKEVEGVHDNKPPSKQVIQVVVNEDELVKFDNCRSLKEKPKEDVEGESTSNYFSEEKIVPPQDEGLNEPQQDG